MKKTEVDIKIIQALYNDLGTYRKVAAELTAQTGDKWTHQSIARRLKKEAVDEPLKPITGGQVAHTYANRKVLTGQRFVFTAAQNNTKVHEEFLQSLLTFCEVNRAQLIVSPFTYNKSGFQNLSKDNDELWYDGKIKPYLLDESVEVNKDLIFCGELDILPTAARPLSGLGSYTQDKSGIVPHVKVAMESLPRMKYDPPKFMYTTGAITQRNYIQRKAGQKAEFHHSFGALYVEINDAGNFFARQLIADNDGTFYDLDTKYTPVGAETGHRVKAITWGDLHLEKADDDVYETNWFAPDSIYNVLRPEYQFLHDVTDFRARNHHSISDAEHWFRMLKEGTDSIDEHFAETAAFLTAISSEESKAIVVHSNHHDAFTRWLKEANVNHDPANALLFYKANYHMFKKFSEGNFNFNVYEDMVREHGPMPHVSFLQKDDSFIICGVEQGMHGHLGPNGARGNQNAFRNLGAKCNIGHVHSAGIIDGVYHAGVSCKLDMGYNAGPTSWSHSHIVTYPNGKRAIITIKDKGWRV